MKHIYQVLDKYAGIFYTTVTLFKSNLIGIQDFESGRLL